MANKELLKSSYIALALVTNGFTNISILNGGYGDWKYEFEQEKGMISIENPKFSKGNFISKFNPNINLLIDDICVMYKQYLKDPLLCFIKELRNFISHHQVLPIVSKFKSTIINSNSDAPSVIDNLVVGEVVPIPTLPALFIRIDSVKLPPPSTDL